MTLTIARALESQHICVCSTLHGLGFEAKRCAGLFVLFIASSSFIRLVVVFPPLFHPLQGLPLVPLSLNHTLCIP